jgi:hypothetical protein
MHLAMVCSQPAMTKRNKTQIVYCSCTAFLMYFYSRFPTPWTALKR